MERFQKLELIKRSLGLRHKLKVHESMKAPETHEDLALMLLSKWEFEDELKAIDDLILESRTKNVSYKRTMVEKEYLETPAETPNAPAKKKAKK
jgi:hypothetical protein